jgi:diguanylate cyclase (GGDEF)-like protein
MLARLASHAEAGVEVSTFADPAGALSGLGTDLIPDLVIAALDLPGMDGASFIRNLRSKETLSDVPVIIVTGSEDSEARHEALDAGATDFLLRPVNRREFRARVRNVLRLGGRQRMPMGRASVESYSQPALTPFSSARGLEKVVETLPVAMAIVDAEARLVLANRAHRELFSIDRHTGIGRPVAELYPDHIAQRLAHVGPAAHANGQPASTFARLPMAGQGGRDLLLLRSTLPDGAGRTGGAVFVAVELDPLAAALPRDAPVQRADSLSGLPDLDSFRVRAEAEIARANTKGEMLAFMHLDLDRYKGINDAFGVELGDELLGQVASRLSSHAGAGNLIARLPGDEFIILQSAVQRSDQVPDFHRRLGEAFATPFLIGGQEVHLSASAGITIFPADGRSLASLLKNAELAMYRAKASGRDSVRFFAAEMNVAARRAVTLERELRQSLAAGQFVVHYQPQLAIASGRVIGVEALVRWNHPRRGLVRPGEFIGLVEDIGLIAPLTSWVLQTACRQMREWREEGLEGVRLSINLSPVQFRERGVELLVERVLQETGVAPQDLDIELTENAVIDNSQTATASLRYLDRLGVSLSIDDFGTGYSSLSYVQRLPVCRLKIDQSFINNLPHSTNDAVIVRAIINLGHSLGLRVIAEGVETPAQLDQLRRYGCDEAQGHLISPPLPAGDAGALLLDGPCPNIPGLVVDEG